MQETQPNNQISIEIDEKIQEQLQNELQNYLSDPSKFHSYIDTMKKIDQWLQGEEGK